MNNKICFYRVSDEFGEFSNFANYPIFIKNKNWPTTEHFFQASKFEEYELMEKIRQLKSPMKAAKEGRNRKNPLRKDWESIKDEVMYEGVSAKFFQHPELRQKLLKTKNLRNSRTYQE